MNPLLKVIIAKLTSAQFWMSILTTMTACVLTVLVVLKHPEKSSEVITVFFTTWGVIITFYFKRDRNTDGNLADNSGK